MKHATTMLVAGLSLTVTPGSYIFFTTMMRRVFIAKTKHSLFLRRTVEEHVEMEGDVTPVLVS